MVWRPAFGGITPPFLGSGWGHPEPTASKEYQVKNIKKMILNVKDKSSGRKNGVMSR
jgi:hypothetical protein